MVAVTALTALLAVGAGQGAGPVARVSAAVAAGQLTIGWSNDLLDASRDRQVARRDKPLATGQLSAGAVRAALALAAVACVALSLWCGLPCAAVHLVLVVGSGWAYNLRLKRTMASWVPYAVAFGSLPAVAALSLPVARLPAAWVVAAGALLGVGAHLVNALPDLADDDATGVRGLPQRLGRRGVTVLAPVVLLAGSTVAVLGPGLPAPAWAWTVLGACAVLALVARRGLGRVPFLAAIAMAVLDALAVVLR